KVAWKASSARWPSPRARRQTPSTIGPCRRTRAANAASSPSALKRRSSAPSPTSSASAPASRRRESESVPPVASDMLTLGGPSRPLLFIYAAARRGAHADRRPADGRRAAVARRGAVGPLSAVGPVRRGVGGAGLAGGAAPGGGGPRGGGGGRPAAQR